MTLITSKTQIVYKIWTLVFIICSEHDKLLYMFGDPSIAEISMLFHPNLLTVKRSSNIIIIIITFFPVDDIRYHITYSNHSKRYPRLVPKRSLAKNGNGLQYYLVHICIILLLIVTIRVLSSPYFSYLEIKLEKKVCPSKINK